jgi:hypothetical protein
LAKDWVQQRLAERKPVLLTNSYLFQVMKAISQENQRIAEEVILFPMLGRTLAGLVSAAPDEQTRRLFGVPLALLGQTEGGKLPEVVLKQAEEVKQNPLFTPRGHYAESETLQDYFRAMQHLAKATIDVAVNRDRFQLPTDMLYPFDTAQSVARMLQDPQNKAVAEQWALIHGFYTGLNGASDLPTFCDIAEISRGKPLTKDMVQAWAKARNIPRINREIGLGIQPFGERFTLHESIIDEFKRLLVRDDTSWQDIADMLSFHRLFSGVTASGKTVDGLAARMGSSNGPSYYDRAIQAIADGAPAQRAGKRAINLSATCLTALAEQTALMTKTSVMVQKSADEAPKIPRGVKLSFEPLSEKYLVSLADAASVAARQCAELKRRAPQDLASSFTPVDAAPAFRAFARMAGRSHALVTGSREWNKYGPFVVSLVRPAAVTVDVFLLKDRTGAMSYYQWALASFEREASGGARGLEMVFFEGWSDEIVPQHQGPLTNQQWINRIKEGKLHVLKSPLNIPR